MSESQPARHADPDTDPSPAIESPRERPPTWPGAALTCYGPVVPGVERDDWPLEDPKGKPIERVREIKTDITKRVRGLLEQRGWLRAESPL